MAPDPFYRKLLEISWRRKLTESEAAELQAWLAAHPEIHAEWQEEAQLNELLEALPDAPMPSNFTARVLAEVEREEKLQARAGGSSWRFWNWRFRWLPRAAFAAVVLGSGLLAYHQHVIARERRELAVDLAKLAAVGSTPSEILTNYAAIRLMTAVNERPAAATADTDILRLLQ